ncbi:Peptidase M15 [Prevotella sp. ne3005]|nr:Peptidase M15 [Prevotella sp. ne3005]
MSPSPKLQNCKTILKMEKVELNKTMHLSEHLASPSEAALSHSSKLDGLRLSPHFTLGEVTKTSVKTAGENIPSRVAIENLKNLCENWLEELRENYNLIYEGVGDCKGDEPIIITSGYRSPEVNKAVGGSPTSNHLTGCAVDIRCAGIEQAIRYACILLDIADGTKRDYDELFIERSSKGNYWIHFAVRPKENRRRTAFIQT